MRTFYMCSENQCNKPQWASTQRSVPYYLYLSRKINEAQRGKVTCPGLMEEDLNPHVVVRCSLSCAAWWQTQRAERVWAFGRLTSALHPKPEGCKGECFTSSSGSSGKPVRAVTSTVLILSLSRGRFPALSCKPCGCSSSQNQSHCGTPTLARNILSSAPYQRR